MTAQREPDDAGTTAQPDADRGPTAMRGVLVAIAILGGAALVFLVLALTSGVLNG